MTDSYVPFQPNANPDGSANAAAGKDDAILYGAVVADPGGLPKGTHEYLTFSRFYNAPGEPFRRPLRLRSGAGALDAGQGAAERSERLDRDAGDPQSVRRRPARRAT